MSGWNFLGQTSKMNLAKRKAVLANIRMERVVFKRNTYFRQLLLFTSKIYERCWWHEGNGNFRKESNENSTVKWRQTDKWKQRYNMNVKEIENRKNKYKSSKIERGKEKERLRMKN